MQLNQLCLVKNITWSYQRLIPETGMFLQFLPLLTNPRGTHQLRFRVLTLRTENEFLDETIQHVLQLIRLMRSIDNVTVILNIKLGLCSQLTTKIFGGIYLGKKKFYHS